MNSVIASCGHNTPAVGFEGSIARRRCQSEPCFTCRQAAADAEPLPEPLPEQETRPATPERE